MDFQMTEAIYQCGAHLSHQELLPQESACPLCTFTGTRRTVITLQEDPRVDLLACPCGCMSASRMPQPQVLRDYYSRYYATFTGQFPAAFQNSDRLARHILRALDIKAQDNIRILDFGGGVDAPVSRAMARRLIERGTRHVGIALVDYNAFCQRDWGAITVDCYQELEEARAEFDAIVASAIVEHIPYPQAVLRTLVRSLRPGGAAYFRTPSMSSILKLGSRLGMHIDFTYPAHVHDMGQAFWDNLHLSMGSDCDWRLTRSRPAIVEADFRRHPVNAAVAFLFKLPWYALRSHYTMVGGWEAIIARGT